MSFESDKPIWFQKRIDDLHMVSMYLDRIEDEKQSILRHLESLSYNQDRLEQYLNQCKSNLCKELVNRVGGFV